MPQLFHPSTNTFAKVSIFGAVFIIAAALWVFLSIERSSYVTQAQVVREQPIPFSHRHHVSQLGIDCRYCHTTVEESNFAGIPTTKTCMTCHSQIHSTAEMLEPVRESWRTGKSLEWIRVHDLPDFVYFNHSIHASGIMVLTPGGKLSRYFYGVEYSAKDLKFGLMEAANNKIGSAVDQLLLYCYHYDPVTGKYGMVIMTVIRISGTATVLVLAVFMVAMFRRDRKAKSEERGADHAEVEV